MYKTATLCLLWLALAVPASAQYAITLKKIHQPTIDISSYKQIGIGDIVGPQGGRTQHAMNLADEIYGAAGGKRHARSARPRRASLDG